MPQYHSTHENLPVRPGDWVPLSSDPEATVRVTPGTKNGLLTRGYLMYTYKADASGILQVREPPGHHEACASYLSSYEKKHIVALSSLSGQWYT